MSMSTLSEVSAWKSFGGWQKVFKYTSQKVGCEMKFGVYLPPKALASQGNQCPVLYWLSGLTCTEENFIQKSGFQQFAAQHNIIVVNPDTSPRGCNIEGENEAYDFGSGAGFYLDATEEKWKTNYQMYSYVVDELIPLVESSFPILAGKRGIFGHSMGGHGALTISLKNPGKFQSVSAFAPICNPIKCGWGQKAFTGYLGKDKNNWNNYDSCYLAKAYKGPIIDILVDQGEADSFLKCGQLLPDNLVDNCAENSLLKLTLRMQTDYDHSFFFIASFMEDHMKHHAKHLMNA